MSTRNKRQLFGGLIGGSIAFTVHAMAFPNDGEATFGLLLAFGLMQGALPGFIRVAERATKHKNWPARKSSTGRRRILPLVVRPAITQGDST